ncbi:hypothetical protein SDC9_133129 [bioreactor metagenome]|uniref:Uncharacterized protein n=1 Tax=bioreactor metagenome TaxID=1076179 RepID=A0A645D9F8_9ZZZZ
MKAYADQLETLLLSEKERKEKAAAFRAEGIALQKVGRNAEAIEKYRQSLSYKKDPQLEAHVKKLYDKLQRDMKEAVRLRNEGIALQKTGRLKDALRMYKLSLSLYPMPDLEAHVKGIERKIAEQVERTKLATLLYNEATVLRKQGKIEAALEKYRRSVELMPNKRADDIIAALEKDVAKMNERREREEALRKEKQGHIIPLVLCNQPYVHLFSTPPSPTWPDSSAYPHHCLAAPPHSRQTAAGAES